MWVRAATQPKSARLELVGPIQRLSDAGSLSLHLPVSLAGPALSGSTRTSRRCRGCFHPTSPSRPVRLPPASLSPLRRTDGGVLSSPHGLAAPHGARNQRPTRGSEHPDPTPA